MNSVILEKISDIKKMYKDDGFVIDGVFGSYFRGDYNAFSDIDILYDLTQAFRNKYKGFKAVARINEIQESISAILGIKADLVQKQTLGEISSRYILKEVHYVE